MATRTMAEIGDVDVSAAPGKPGFSVVSFQVDGRDRKLLVADAEVQGLLDEGPSAYMKYLSKSQSNY